MPIGGSKKLGGMIVEVDFFLKKKLWFMVDIAITGYNYSHGLLTNIHIMFGKNPEKKMSNLTSSVQTGG